MLLHLIPLVPLADQESVRTTAIEKLKALVPADSAAWCTTEFEVRFEFPAEGILAAAQRHNSDVIVMGVQHSGHSRAVSHLPWAIPTEVLAQTSCPVLTVRG